MKYRSLTLAALMLATLPAISHAQDQFTFEGQTPNSFLISGSTLAAESNPARTATFTVTGAALPNAAFQFVDNAGSSGPMATNLSGIELQNVDSNPADVLTILFHQAVNTVKLSFAIVSFTPGTAPTNTLTLTSNTGLTDIETGMFNSTSGLFEGTLALTSATPFDSIALVRAGDNIDYYAIDNVFVTPSASVPEPGVLALTVTGLLPLGLWLRRRRK